jgi:DNA-binding MarR family transcriptional regulator
MREVWGHFMREHVCQLPAFCTLTKRKYAYILLSMETPSDDQVRERLALLTETCIWSNLRRATRTITNYYDALLGPLSGLRVSQAGVLAVLYLTGAQTINELAEKLALDRTTLGRNLRPIEQRGLLSLTAGDDQRTRIVQLTAQGKEILLQILPWWEQTQAHMVAHMQPDQVTAFLALLTDLSARTHEE